MDGRERDFHSFLAQWPGPESRLCAQWQGLPDSVLLVAASFQSHVSKLGFPEFPESLGWKGLLELGWGEGESRQVKDHMTGQNESVISLAPYY